MARRHVVVSGHYYASLAGLQVLEAGGNAIDAGVATGLAIDVLESEFVGFGGVAPVMIHLGRTRRDACDQRRRRLAEGRRPRALPPQLRRAHPRGPAAHRGSRRAEHLDRRTGALRHDVVRRGRGGGDPLRARRVSRPIRSSPSSSPRGRTDFSQWPSTAAIFLPDGRPPEVGEIFVQSDLGRTLQYMADQERAHAHGDRLAGLQAARDAFYRGDIAGAIVRHQRENGGWLTERRSGRIPQSDRTAVPHPLRRVRCLRLRRLVAGADGAGGAEHPAGPRPARHGAQLRRLHPRGDRGAEARRRGSRGLFRRSGFRRCAAGCAVVGRLRGAAARADRSGEGVARHAAGGRGRRRVDPALAPRSFRRRAAGDRRRQAGDLVPVRRRQPWQRVRRHAERSDDQRGRWCREPASPSRCGVRAATPGRTIRRASVPDGGRACRPIRRSRSSRARW